MLKRSPRLAFTAKVIISLAILTWLLSEVNWSHATDVASRITWIGLTGILAANALFICIRTWRLHLLLKDHVGFILNYATLLRYYLISCFFGLFLPGGLAGDWIRTARINRHAEDLSFSIQSVLLERYLGLWALLGLFFSFLFLPGHDFGFNHGMGIAFGIHLDLGPVLLFLFFAASLPPVLVGLGQAHRLPLPTQVKQSIQRIRPATLVKATLLSLLVQLSSLLVYWCLAKALGLNLPVILLTGLVLATSLANILPLGIPGLGLNQIVMVLGLRAFQSDADLAVLFSLSVFALDVLTGCLGALFFIVDHRSQKQSKAGGQ
jgi:glycosyltransferase 2 family protein